MIISQGPWTVERNPQTAATWNVYDATGIRICEVLAGPSRFTKPYYGPPMVDPEDAVDGPHNAAAIGALPDLIEQLSWAESFISGFEGDELQEGIDGKLSAIRAALAKAAA